MLGHLLSALLVQNYCILKLILSRVRGSVTNNNGFWIYKSLGQSPFWSTYSVGLFCPCTFNCSQSKSESKLCYDRRSVGQSVLVSSPIQDLRTDFFFLFDSCGFVDVGHPLWREDGSVYYNVQYMYILHVITWMYIQYIQGLCQSRLSTADHELSFVASAYKF
jgi:hypothetical protein